MSTPVPDTGELAGRLQAARLDDDDARVEAMVRARLFGPAHAPPATIGRFTLLERIGRGGMGDVFAAYDPVLDRKVAIKLVRAGVGLDAGERGWLLREARAAARLNHPNVVAVHEVGELGEGDGEGVYVAMELLEGVTLRAWLRERRSVAAILRVFVQAGRGLAAAHEAGLVHRDFKPENVLVCGEGADARARVVDFGLARAAERRLADAAAAAASGETTKMGTPAYMSPEQLQGRPLDGRSDLFAFCVALEEALAGRHPFGADRPGAAPEQILARIVAGERIRGERTIPAWLRALLDRGLQADPADRPPSMHALVRALEATPTRRRRRALVGAAIALAIGSSAITAASVDGLARSACADLEGELVGVWDPPLRAAARRHFAAAGLGHAGEVWARLEPRVDEYARALVVRREQTCQGRLGGAAISAELAGLRDGCLDRRRAELQGLTELLRAADPSTVAAAITAVDALTPIAVCDDLESLRREDPGPGPGAGRAIEAMRRELLRLRSRVRAGHAREVAEESAALIAAADALAAPLLRAEARSLRALVDEMLGDHDAAATGLEAAVLAAVAARDDRLHAEAATRLVWLHGVRRRDPAAGRAWVARAEAAIRASGDDPRLIARLLDHRGALAGLDHDHAAAIDLHRQALALHEGHAAPGDVALATSTGNLGLALLARGDAAAAAPLIEAALARFRDAFGPGHPEVAAMLANLGRAHVVAGDHGRGLSLLREALALKERTHGPEDPALLTTLESLGSAHSELGQAPEARAYYLRALAIGERELGSASPKLESILHNLAFESWVVGDHAAVIAEAGRALELQRRLYGEAHPILAPTLELLARGHLGLGDHAAADLAIDRALALARAGEAELTAPVRGQIFLSAAWIGRASGARPDLVRGHAHVARELLGDAVDAAAAAELAALLGP